MNTYLVLAKIADGPGYTDRAADLEQAIKGMATTGRCWSDPPGNWIFESELTLAEASSRCRSAINPAKDEAMLITIGQGEILGRGEFGAMRAFGCFQKAAR